jgi:hypothetical protein
LALEDCAVGGYVAAEGAMKDEWEIAAFVGIGLWVWFVIAELLAQAIAGFLVFEQQFH